jgi:hypothetical protein
VGERCRTSEIENGAVHLCIDAAAALEAAAEAISAISVTRIGSLLERLRCNGEIYRNAMAILQAGTKVSGAASLVIPDCGQEIDDGPMPFSAM